MYKILLVDDDQNILHGYRRNLRSRYDIHTAEGAVNAFMKLKEHDDFAVIISDYNMPMMNGLDFLIKSQEFQPDAVRIILTGNATVHMLEKAINQGDIFRVLMKPCSHSDLVKTLEESVQRHKKIIAEKEVLSKTLLGTIKIVTDILSSVSPLAFNKAAFFNNMAKRILSRLHRPFNWETEAACLLSQIGCVTVPNEIFVKHDRGEELTAGEAELMRTHPLTGASILRNIPRMEKIANSIEKQQKSNEEG
ncbi:MAG: response regulator, partial [Ignavibacteria bacterium]